MKVNPLCGDPDSRGSSAFGCPHCPNSESSRSTPRHSVFIYKRPLKCRIREDGVFNTSTRDYDEVKWVM